MPAETLNAIFGRLHRRMRRFAVLEGIAWCSAAGLAFVLAACLLDWWVHLDDPRWRTALLAAGAVCWGALAAWRIAVPALRRYSAVETALEVERLQPDWKGALASSVEFLSGDCRAEHGAPRLQQALIARTGRQLDYESLLPLVKTRSLTRGIGCTLALLIVAVVLLVSAPASARLALARLFDPADAASWPRRHTLVLLDAAFRPFDPARPRPPAAMGERLVVYVDDRQSRLPDDVVLHVAESDRGARPQPLERTTVVSDGRRRELGVAVIPTGSPRVRIRATGGDDHRMPWHTFEFAPRPGIERLAIHLTPPRYARLETRELITTAGDIEALVGTRVRIDAHLTQPAADAQLGCEGLSPIRTELSDDGRTFSVEFDVPPERSSYWFELTDANGLRNANPTRYSVTGQVDREPGVALTQPASDLTVTPQAQVPIQVQAQDDFGLASLRLLFSEPPGSAGEQARPLPLEDQLPREAALQTELSIPELGLEAGRRLIVRAEASDACDLDGRHVVRSVARTLTVVSPDEKLRELVARQSAIAEDLEHAYELQTRSLRQTRMLQLQWRTAGSFSAADRDLLQRIAHDQAQIAATLHDDQRGTARQSQNLLQELAWNRIDGGPVVPRLEHLQRELDRLRSEVDPVLTHALSLAGKQAALAPDEASQPLEETLETIERTQTAAAEALDALVAQFAQWQQFYDLTRQLAELAAEQQRLVEDTRELGRKTLTSPFEALTPEQRAALARLGQRQEHAAESLEDFRDRLRDEGQGQQDAQHGAPGFDTQRALQFLDDELIIENMRRAAQFVTRNAIPQAATAQQEISTSLARLEEVIRGLADTEPETLVRRVEAARAAAESLEKRQADLRSRAAALSGDSPSEADRSRLIAEQQDLSSETADLAQRLRRQTFSDEAQLASQAADAMQNAAAELSAQSTESATAAQQQAIDDLAQVQKRLAALQRRLEFERTLAEWSRVASMLDTFAQRQGQLLAETERLQAEQKSRGTLSRSQLRTLKELGGAQTELAGDVAELRDRPDGSAVLREALAPVLDDMHTAAERLADRQLDDRTRQLQSDAVHQLQALQHDLTATAAAVRSGSTPGDMQTPQDETAPNWPLAAQLQILTRLQSELARKAAALQSGSDAPPDEQQLEWQALAETQLRLATLLEQLLGAPPQGESLQ